jgi:hypothetical protein
VIVAIGLVLLIGYFVIVGKTTGTASDKDAAEWAERLEKSGNLTRGSITTEDMAGT